MRKRLRVLPFLVWLIIIHYGDRFSHSTNFILATIGIVISLIVLYYTHEDEKKAKKKLIIGIAAIIISTYIGMYYMMEI